MSAWKNGERDLSDAAKLVNEDTTVNTRYGPQPKKSFLRLQNEFEAAGTAAIDELNKSRGFRVVGTFVDGFEYELYNDVGTDADGNPWIYIDPDGPAHTVTAGTDPSAFPLLYEQRGFNSASDVLNDDGTTAQDTAGKVSDLDTTHYRVAGDLSDVVAEGKGLLSLYDVMGEPAAKFVKVASGTTDNLTILDLGDGSFLESTYAKAVKNITSGIVTTGKADLGMSKIALTGVDEPTIKAGSGNGQTTGVYLSNFILSGDDPQPTNNQAVFTGSSLKYSIVSNFIIESGYNGVGLEFGSIVVGERRSGSTIYDAAISKASYIGFEMFSPYASMLNGIADRHELTRGIQHGLRVTGYGINHENQGNDLRNVGNSYSVIANNYANGLSIQTGAYGNNIEITALNCLNGLQSSKDETLGDAISSSNNVVFTSADSDQHGAFLNNPLSSVFTGTVLGCGDKSFYTLKSPLRDCASNVYNMSLRDALGTRFEDSFSIMNVTSRDINTGVEIIGDSNIVNMTFDNINNQSGSSPCATISGSSNIARVVAGDLNQTSQSQFNVVGNDNIVDVNVAKSGADFLEIIVSGTGNIVSGNCKINVPASDADNDFSRVKGWSQVGSESVTTDAGGRATVPVSTPSETYFVDCNNRNFTEHYNILITGRNSTSFTIIAYNQDGTLASGVSLSLLYKIDCYIAP